MLNKKDSNDTLEGGLNRSIPPENVIVIPENVEKSGTPESLGDMTRRRLLGITDPVNPQ